MGFLIAAICLGVMSIVWAIQGDFDAFGGGIIIAAILVGCWFIWKKVKGKKPAKFSTYSPTYIQPSTPINIPQTQNIQQDATPMVPQYITENHHVTGTSYYKAEIESLGVENALYECTKKELIDDGCENERIYQFDFYPNKVELIEEPDNEHDPNAIKVMVDGVCIGYIKKGSCPHVKKILHSGAIMKIEAEIGGGKYKYLSCEYDDEKGKDVYTLERNETGYDATVVIKYSNQSSL